MRSAGKPPSTTLEKTLTQKLLILFFQAFIFSLILYKSPQSEFFFLTYYFEIIVYSQEIAKDM